jgi:hypothetical protein
LIALLFIQAAGLCFDVFAADILNLFITWPENYLTACAKSSVMVKPIMVRRDRFEALFFPH